MENEHQPNDLIASYHRCRGNGDFIGTFYEIFLAKSPDIAAQFAHTDFTVQKLMLRQSLLELLLFEQGISGVREEIVKLGRRHEELDITEEMYGMWLDSLCDTVRKHDPMITPELESLWRQAMQNGIDVMLSHEDE